MINEIKGEMEYLLERVRTRKPLVHHITNYVTANDCANITLAAGASPIMADDINEVEEITEISSSLILNIGTLNERTLKSMIIAGKAANKKGIPVILDPVGAGVSKFRNKALKIILDELKIDILKGNMSEIFFISGLREVTEGLDVSEDDANTEIAAAVKTAKILACKLGCIVVITGVTDIITDGEKSIGIKNGDKLLTQITGTGCMSASLIGSFSGVCEDLFLGAVTGILCMGIAGEAAAEKTKETGNGSFRSVLIDQISKIRISDIVKKEKIYKF